MASTASVHLQAVKPQKDNEGHRTMDGLSGGWYPMT